MTSSLLKRLVQTCLGVGSSGQVAREGQDESGEVEREAIRPKGTGSGSEPNPLRHNPLEVTLLGAEPIQVINGNPSQRVFKATWCGRSPVQLHVLQFCKRPNPLAELPGPNSPHTTVCAALDAPPPVQANMMVQPDMVTVATEVEAALVQLLAEPLPNVVPVLACAKVSCRAHISSPGDDQVTQRVMAEVHVVTPHVAGLLSLAEWLRSRGPPPKAGSSDEPPGQQQQQQQQQRGGTGAASTAAVAAAAGAPTAAAGREDNKGRGQAAKGGDAAPGAAAVAAAAAAPGRVPAQAAAAAAAPALATSAGGPQAVGESTSANGSTPGGESSGSGSGSGPVASSCLRMKCLSTAPVAAGSKPSAPAASAPGAAPAPAPATAPAAAAAVTQAAPPAAPRTAAAASTSAPMKPAPVGAGAAAPAAGPGPAPRRLGAAAAGAGGVGAGRPGALPPAPRPAANPFVPVLDAVEVLLAVAEALKGLHRKGIPHGHITPSVVQLQLAPAPAPPPSASAASQQGQGHATQQERSAGNTSAVSTKSSKALATVDTVMAGFLTPEDRPASQQAARGPSTSTAGDAGEPYDGTCLGQGGEGSGSTLGGMGLLGVHRELGSVGSTMGSTGFSVGPFRPFGGVPGADLLGPGGLPTVPEGSGTATSTSPSAQLNTDNTHTSLSKSASAANMPALAAGATSVSLGPKRPTAGPSTSAQPGSLSAAAFTPSLNPDSTAAPPPHSSSSTDIAPARPATSSAPVTTILPSAFSTAASIPLLSTAAPASAPTSRQPPSSAFATAAQALRLRAILPLPALCPAMLQMLTWGRARPVGLPQEQLLWAAPELLNTGLGPSIHWGWAAPHLLANKGSGGGMGGGSLGAEHVGVRNGRRAAAAWGGRPDHGGTHTARPEREWSRDREGGREGGHHGGMGGSLGASRRYRSQGAPLLLMGKDPHSASNACGITPACDVYALGLLMWHLMSGAQPLSHLATNEVLRLKELGWLDEQLPFGAHVPMAYVDLARRCWSPAPMSRPPVTMVAQELRRLRAELQQLAGRGTGPNRVPSSLLPLLDTSGRHRSAAIAAMDGAVVAGGGHGGGPSSAEDNGDPTMDSRLSFTLSVALSSRAMSDDGSMLARPPLELALGVPPPPPGAATAPGALHSLTAGGLAAAGDGGADGSGDGKLVASAAALPPPPTALPAALLTALTARNRDADGGGGGCMDDDSYMSYTDTDRFTDHAETVTERSASIGTVNSSTPTIGNSGRAKNPNFGFMRGGSLGGPLGKWNAQGGSTENARQQQLQQAQQQAAQQGGVSGAAAMFLLNMGLGNTWGSCGPVGGAGPGLKRRQASCAADAHRPRGTSPAPGAAAGAPPPAGPSASSSASASGGNGGGGGSGRMPTAVAAALGLSNSTRHF